MTSIEVPSHTDAVAAILPTLHVRDISEDVQAALAATGIADGIAYLTGEPGTIVRVQEREAGFFCDVEELLTDHGLDVMYKTVRR